MHIKKFHGRNMRESIEMMRREIGGDAVILSSGQIELDGVPMTELVAGIHPEDLDRFRQQRRSDSVSVPADILHAAGGTLNPPQRRSSEYSEDKSAVSSARQRPNNRVRENNSDLNKTLQDIQSALKDLATTQRFRFTNALPEAFKNMYEELRSKGFTEEQSMFYIGNLSARGLSGGFDEIKSACITLIEKSVRCVSPLNIGSGRSVVLIVGMPGSGKTTFASLLSQSLNLTINAACTVYSNTVLPNSLHTTDGVRHVAYSNMYELTKHLTETSAEDFSFVELTLSPNDDAAWQQLEEISDVISPDCVLITVPSGSHSMRVQSWIQFGEAVENCSFVFTGVDVDSLPGEHVYTLAEHNLPISYLTFGSSSPMDLRAAGGESVTEAIFHRG